MRNLIPCICCLLVTACGAPQGSPEDALQEWVARGEAAVEKKDRQALLGMISDAYADARGNNRKDIGDLLGIYFRRLGSFGLFTDIGDIMITGDTAAMIDLTVGMAGTGDSATGLSADAYSFEFELQKSGDEWLLIGARWGELGRILH